MYREFIELHIVWVGRPFPFSSSPGRPIFKFKKRITMFRNVFLSLLISMEDKFLLDWTTSAVYKFNDPGRPRLVFKLIGFLAPFLQN